MNPAVFKALRREHTVSILELAYVTGISHELIAGFELGYNTLPGETLEMLADAIQKYEKKTVEQILEKYWDLFGGDYA